MKPALLVLAAGIGSRYGGVKQIDGVGRHNETLLDYSTYDAKRAGFGKAVYVIRPEIEKEFCERFFNRVSKNFDAEYVFQTHDKFLNSMQLTAAKDRKKPWGTIHAVICAKDAVKTPFAIINADDYYGRSAFEIMGKYLSSITNESTEHAMVGYMLGNTLSKSGMVSRGICEIKNNELASMKENKEIGYEGNRIISIIDGKKIECTGNEWVSMNFFGFSIMVMENFVQYFEKFISENAENEKAECLLPSGVNEIVSSGKGKIKFFTSQDNWFGMTYPEDREKVRKEIEKKINDGCYPDMLWEK
ncbi:MAG: hypothetical protein LBD07_01230 [Spirochaetaceae bacterium]|jgi:choline kinase|nr:hypothetical protein [Spirochaetaceae bacterium]